MLQDSSENSPAATTAKPLRRRISRADLQWLRWGIICVSVLSVQVLLQFGGQFDACGTMLTAALMPETAESTTSVLSPAVTFLISIPLTMYGTIVLLNSGSMLKNTVMTTLACVALALPMAAVALWNMSLHTLPLICSVLLMMLLADFTLFIDKKQP